MLPKPSKTTQLNLFHSPLSEMLDVPLEKEVIQLLEGFLKAEKNKRVFYNIDEPIFLNRSHNKFTTRFPHSKKIILTIN